MCNDKNNNSGFIVGLIVGALIASAIVLVSSEDKQKILKKIKSKFQDLLNNKVEPEIKKDVKIIKKAKKVITKKVVEPIKKISVTIPKNIESINLTPTKTPKPKKVFKKTKT